MRGKCPAAARLRDRAKHFALISQRAGPLTASVYALRAAFGGCAPTRACGRSPSGEAFKETAMKGIKTHDPLRTNAQKLRRKMTPQERRLWYDFLKNLPQTVYRQKIIGNFIVDFYISSCKLVIELDGAQHTEPQAVEYDAQRTAYLQGIGCRVLCCANNAVDTNFAGVCEDILHNIG